MALAALAAAIGASAIGLRVSFTSERPLKPLLDSDNGAAVTAVAEAVVDQVRRSATAVPPRSELRREAVATIEADPARWERSIRRARLDTLEVSETGTGKSGMDIEWIIDDLDRRGVVERDVFNPEPIQVVDTDRATSIASVRSWLNRSALLLPLFALAAAAGGLAASRRDRIRSARVFALAAAATTLVLGVIVWKVPRWVVTGLPPTEATRTLAGQVVDAITVPVMVAFGVLFAIELVAGGISHVVIRRRLRQATPAAPPATG